MGPLSKPLLRIEDLLDRKAEEKEKSFSIEQVSSALEAVSQAGSAALAAGEARILQGIVQMGDVEASAIMTPRVKVVGVPLSARFDEVMRLIREAGYSRMPVYQDSLDKITGVLHIKDVLPHLSAGEAFNWRKLVRPALFASETEKIAVLLRRLQEGRLHMAIVTDEYGSTSGLVSLEDILEEVVGDISDEFDEDNEDALYRKVSDHVYLFDARMPIHDFCRLMRERSLGSEDGRKTSDEMRDFFESYEEGEYETLAGFILETLGRFPKKGEIVAAGPYVFTVMALDRRRIKQIKMSIEDEGRA